MKKTLIIYSTTDGQTKRICDRIIEFSNKKLEVTLCKIENAFEVDLAQYTKIVIGASIRYGKHNPKVREFIENNLEIISDKHNAFFTVNVVARKSTKNTPQTNPYLIKFLNSIFWKPDIVDVFAGRLDYPSLNFWDKQIIRLIMYITKGPTDLKKTYEFTDWKRVEEFSLKIINLIK